MTAGDVLVAPAATAAASPTRARCPACQAIVAADGAGEVRDHITREPFHVLRCQRCALAFTWPVPANLDRFYPARYRGYSGLTRIALRSLYRDRVKGWIRGLPPGRALEIGCGAGLMLDALRQHGWAVMGVERTEAMARYARTALGLEVIAGGVTDVPSSERFDLVVLFQVLEHLHDPVTTLATCAALLKPGGRIIIGVPNLDSWQACFGGADWVHLDPPRHLVHFTPKTLRRLLEQSGLRVNMVTFRSFEHDPYGWVQTAINKVGGSPNLLTRFLMGLERLTPRVLVDALLAMLLLLPALVLAVVSWSARRGALLQVVAEKPVHRS